MRTTGQQQDGDHQRDQQRPPPPVKRDLSPDMQNNHRQRLRQGTTRRTKSRKTEPDLPPPLPLTSDRDKPAGLRQGSSSGQKRGDDALRLRQRTFLRGSSVQLVDKQRRERTQQNLSMRSQAMESRRERDSSRGRRAQYSRDPDAERSFKDQRQAGIRRRSDSRDNGRLQPSARRPLPKQQEQRRQQRLSPPPPTARRAQRWSDTKSES